MDPLFRRSIRLYSDISMADACRARAECRAVVAARVTQTALAGDGCAPRAPSPVANSATDPVGHEQQALSLHPSVHHDGRIATPSLTPAASSSHARRGQADAQATLLMARELLRYRPVGYLYEELLERIAELVSVAHGGSTEPARSLPKQPPAAGDVAHGAPPPPPDQGVIIEPRRVEPRRDPPCPAPTREDVSYQVV